MGSLADAQKLPGSNSLVAGVAAGLAALLGARGILPGPPNPHRLHDDSSAVQSLSAVLQVRHASVGV